MVFDIFIDLKKKFEVLFYVIDSFLLQYKLSVFPPEVNRRIRSIGICPSRKWTNPWWWHFYGNCCSQRNTIVYLVFFSLFFLRVDLLWSWVNFYGGKMSMHFKWFRKCKIYEQIFQSTSVYCTDLKNWTSFLYFWHF